MGTNAPTVEQIANQTTELKEFTEKRSAICSRAIGTATILVMKTTAALLSKSDDLFFPRDGKSCISL